MEMEQKYFRRWKILADSWAEFGTSGATNDVKEGNVLSTTTPTQLHNGGKTKKNLPYLQPSCPTFVN
eukprot:3984067-Ditylum_brightwellii.AAC.1